MKRILAIALPSSFSSFGIMALSLVDIMVVSRISTVHLAAVSFGVSIFNLFAIPGYGFLSGADFPMSRSMGEKKPVSAIEYGLHNLMFAFLGAIFSTLIVYFVMFLLRTGENPQSFMAGIMPKEEIVQLSLQYLPVIAFNYFNVFVFNVFKNYLHAIEKVRPLVVILILANGINLFLNLGLGLGKFGLPALGMAGIATATFVSSAFMALSASSYCFFISNPLIKNLDLKIKLKYWVEIFKLGFPASLHYSLEGGAFCLSGLFVATLTVMDTAAYQLVLSTQSASFMFALGISLATCVLVGNSFGARDKSGIIKYMRHGFSLVIGMMVLFGIFFGVYPETVLNAYTDDPAIIQYAKKSLLIVGLFQIFDGVQVVGSGVLRGLGDTKAPAFFHFIGLWCIGLPLGYVFSKVYQMGIFGICLGLAVGLFTAALLLSLRIRSSLKKLTFSSVQSVVESTVPPTF